MTVSKLKPLPISSNNTAGETKGQALLGPSACLPVAPCQSYAHLPAKRCNLGRWVVVKKRIDNEIIMKRSYIPCGSFDCPYCRAKKRKKLYRLISNACPKSEFNFLSLTLRKNDQPLEENWRRINNDWDVLMKRIKRIFPGVKYFRCVELQENGMPHIHALINFYWPKWMVVRTWNIITGDSFIAEFEKVRKSCAGYILYYFERAINDIRFIRSATGRKTKIFNWSRFLLQVAVTKKEWNLVEMCRTKIESVEVLRHHMRTSRSRYIRAGPINVITDEQDEVLEISFFVFD